MVNNYKKNLYVKDYKENIQVKLIIKKTYLDIIYYMFQIMI